MLVIRQHGENRKLFDIVDFLADVDRYARPETWLVTVDECADDRVFEIEHLTAAGVPIPDAEFQTLYGGILQTIDGCFVGLAGGKCVFELRAVDSSFWEATDSPAFESNLLQTYGAW
ncbi:hypothetical protein [Pseudoxanthomonas winnipegensis]|uniref:Uncharacterized protein n=1 Tax=Pseudoxanthomonas winnipegensis TaxID=2480810 RepID=A0A4Q8M482_9GAMM|nr:hypothetical protein [Pseudoxanthomonas winnipegensis]TAA43457.1 hypothetical protein EA655_09315 [Pseudoxanthomonas winnipegensis]